MTDDGEWMIIRLSDFFATLRSGQFPVRFLGRLNFGHGYPVATFLYPGIMYLGSAIHLFKIGFVSTIKIIIGFSMVGSLIFTYFWLSRIFNRISGFIGAIIYLYIPYHMYDVYTRGSVGEVFALLWVPFIFWNIERESLFFTSLGIAFLILSHNTLAFLFLPLILAYMIIKIMEDRNNKRYLFSLYASSLLLGIGMSIFFLFPAITELHQTQFSGVKISNPLEYFADYRIIGWGTFLVVSFGLMTFFKRRKEKNKTALLFLILGIMSVFFSSVLSGWFWKIIPSGFIQFPFRLLSITVLCAAFLGAYVVFSIKSNYKSLFILVTISLLSISTYQHIYNVKYTDKGEGFYSTNDATTTVKDEYMPKWVKEKPLKRPDKKVEIVEGSGNIENIFLGSNKLSFSANLNSNSTIQVNTVYWPGFSASIDGKSARILYNNSKGLININMPKGKHLVELKFGETPLRKSANSVSMLSLVALLYLSYKNRHAKD